MTDFQPSPKSELRYTEALKPKNYRKMTNWALEPLSVVDYVFIICFKLRFLEKSILAFTILCTLRRAENTCFLKLSRVLICCHYMTPVSCSCNYFRNFTKIFFVDCARDIPTCNFSVQKLLSWATRPPKITRFAQIKFLPPTHM